MTEATVVLERVRQRSPTWRIALRSAQMARAALAASVVFLRELVRERRGGREAPLRALGRALVHLCNDLGATLIKVGQIASTRGDLLPPAIIDEISRLRDQVPPFPFDAVRRTIEGEFGRPLESLYSSFDPVPVAAASVAQVHRAVLRSTGETVAVKVRRPDILDKVRLDRSILLFVARTLERLVPTLRLVSFEGAMREFCDAVEKQIHLTNEAKNNLRFTENFRDEPDIRFPRLHLEACSDAVLTMEFVEGVREEELEARGIDVRRIVENGMRCVCRMIFLHGFVHADLHPGNLRFQAPGRIYVLDLGLVATLTDEDRLTNARLMFALATGDGVTVARIFYDNSVHKEPPNYAEYEADICRFVDSVRNKGLGKIQVTLEIGRIFDLLRRHRIHASSHMTMVNLAMMTVEGLGKRLAPDLSLETEALPYLAEALGMQTPGVLPN